MSECMSVCRIVAVRVPFFADVTREIKWQKVGRHLFIKA